MSLIESMGQSYFREWFNGALFVYNGSVLSVSDTDGSTVRCVNLEVGRDAAGYVVRVPYEFFTGFKVFEYPPLGYRRVGNVVYHVHRSQSAYRGLRGNLLTFELSPLSYLLQGNERTAPRVSNVTANQRLVEVMKPTYDTRASLDELIAGRQTAVVPSEDVCIEPSLVNDNYDVLYRGKVVGSMNTSKEFSINNAVVAAAVQASFRE